ncbi:sensor domain-containing diguanylate cyclase [Marinobacter salicampi]|uniref:sensor domain-containing diguanylate cyclase n=1 Tax=Marinobacter salicampi TaxID=435907 RepID=UPI00140C1105|nr:diguanylate cyclase [Marinobacter salicampi]
MAKDRNRRLPLFRSILGVLVYVLVGGAWITFSDDALVLYFDDPEELTQAQTYKGWGFVLVTSLALFLVLYRQLKWDRRGTEQKENQRTRIHDLSQFRDGVIDNATVWISVVDTSSRILLWNKAAERISGYSRDQVLGRDDFWYWLYPDPLYRDEVQTLMDEVLTEGREITSHEAWITTASGETRRIDWSSRRFYNDDGKLEGIIAIGADVTERRLAEQGLRKRERQLATLMDNLPGMAYRCLYDEFWTMKFVSSGCRALTGYQPQEIIDNREVAFSELVDPEATESMLRSVEEAIGAAEPFSLEYQLTRKDGSRIWVWERGRGVEDEGRFVLEGIILDINDRKLLEQELAEMATRDMLTGLYNRREISRLLEEEVNRAERYHRSLAMLWIDLDHFKSVNDVYGHGVGDEILVALSQRLARSVRSVDLIGRYGGEEFVVLLPEMSESEAWDTAERLRLLVARQPLEASGDIRLTLSISIGVAVFPADGRTVRTLTEAADKAMYRAKDAGRNQVCLASRQLAGESP